MDYQALFSEHLFEIMELRGITKTELAETTGISPAVFTSLSRGTSSPNLKTMQTLSEGLGIPLPIMLQKSDSEAWQAVVAMLMLSHSRQKSVPHGYGWLGKTGYLPNAKLEIVHEDRKSVV